MEASSKFLVTGATGFIGSHLTAALARDFGARAVTALAPPPANPREETARRQLEAQGVAMVECDLLRLPGLGLAPLACDVVYHLAAFAETENPRGRFEVNSQGTRHLLEWLGPRLAGKRVVYTGSLASVDRDYPTTPLTEATPCRPRTAYGRTKLEGEELIRARQPALGYDHTIFRLCTIIGPGFRPGGMFGLFPRSLAAQALATRLNWPGRASFLDVRDLVAILIQAAALPAAMNETFVAGNEETPTFDWLLDQIARLHGCRRRRVVLPPALWRLAARLAWGLVCARGTPFRLHNACWRISHLIHDGLLADASKLNQVFGRRYISVRDALCFAYGK